MLLPRTLATAGVSVLLGAGLVVSTPTTATSAPQFRAWGATSSADHELRPGCTNYRFRYRIDPPTNEWLAEISLINPRGASLSSVVVDSNSNPAKAVRTWRLCRASVIPGKYRIRMKISYCEREDCRPRPIVGSVRPSTFRFTR